MPQSDGGLGTALVGEKLHINNVHVVVNKLLGEGGFAYVYLVKDISDSSDGKNGDDGKKVSKLIKSKDKTDSSKGSGKSNDATGAGADGTDPKYMVLKVTSIVSKQQRDIAEKEAKLLSRLSHPSIIKVFDTCYRTIPAQSSGASAFGRKSDKAHSHKDTTQHLILMEYCEGGHAMGICTQLRERNERFDLSTLIIAFGQICNAVSYLHAQRPPIVHRDLKPENFLIKNGAYKLCDFGSAVFGHIELKTSQARAEAEEEIQKTTTQMYRAPEMVDLYTAKKLTQATDVWALGCCLYNLAFLQNCFEEGSNLAILSRKYKIPDDNPYGEGLVELIDRMLTIDSKVRADMTEVILCLSAVYSNRPLPPRKERTKKDKKEKEEGDTKSTSGEKSSHAADKEKKDKKKVPSSSSSRAGSYRTDGQGVHGGENLAIDPKAAKTKEVKKLDPNSAAARRRMAANADASSVGDFAAFDNQFEKAKQQLRSQNNNGDDLAFSTTDNPFATAAFDSAGGSLGHKLKRIASKGNGDWVHQAKEGAVDAAFDALTVGGTSSAKSIKSHGPDDEARRKLERIASGRSRKETLTRDPLRRSRSKDIRRAVRRPSMKKPTDGEDGTDNVDDDDDDGEGDDCDDDDQTQITTEQQQYQQNQSALAAAAASLANKSGANPAIKVIKSRGVRRANSTGQGLQRTRSRSRGAGLRKTSSHSSGGRSGEGGRRGFADDDDDEDSDEDSDEE